MKRLGDLREKVAIDAGTYYVKSSNEDKFESRLEESKSVMAGGKGIEVTFNGKNYSFEKGSFDASMNKAERENLLVSIATMLAYTLENDCYVELAVGLPINHYASQKNKLKKTLEENKNIDITLNGVNRKFIIDKVIVLPEAVGVYYSLSAKFLKAVEGRELLIIDVGGKTTDTCIIDQNQTIVNPSTQSFGMLSLYNKIANAINAEYTDFSIKPEDVRDILDNGLYNFDEKLDISFIDSIFDKFVDDIVKFVKVQYADYRRKVIVLSGGGFVLGDRFKKEFPNLIVNDDIFANAKGFKRYLDMNGDSEI